MVLPFSGPRRAGDLEDQLYREAKVMDIHSLVLWLDQLMGKDWNLLDLFCSPRCYAYVSKAMWTPSLAVRPVQHTRYFALLNWGTEELPDLCGFAAAGLGDAVISTQAKQGRLQRTTS